MEIGNIIGLVLFVTILLIVVGGGIVIYIMGFIAEEKEKDEYKKSLFRCLNAIDYKILSQYDLEKCERIRVIREFRDISKNILKLDNRHSGIKNMRLIDSLSYHEKNALEKVNKSLDVGILLTDEKINNALVEITKGLNKIYKEFCDLQTADIEEEIYILKVLEQKEKERKMIGNGMNVNE